MAARPNPQKNLVFINTLAKSQLKRVNKTIKTIEVFLKKAKNLTKAEKAEYRQFLSVAKKQRTAFAKVTGFKIPKAKYTKPAKKTKKAKRTKTPRTTETVIVTGGNPMFPSVLGSSNGKGAVPDIVA